MKIINEFHELHPPETDSSAVDGSLEDFCTCDKYAGGMYYLLNGGRMVLGDLHEKLHTREFYFNTESECHADAADYYSIHNRKYPYVDEWAAASVWDDFASNNLPDPACSESQEMKFI